MLSTISLTFRLWAAALLTLLVLYLLSTIVVMTWGPMNDEAGGVFVMAALFTLLGSLPAFVIAALLLPLLVRKTPGSSDAIVAQALLLVTVACGLPAGYVTYAITRGHLSDDSLLLLFPVSALIGSWVSVLMQREAIIRYANPAAATLAGDDLDVNDSSQAD